MNTEAVASAVIGDPQADSAKRRQIVDGACRVFLSQGFDAASMGAIAREAGVSKGTLYVYFKNKEELFAAIVEERRRQQAEEIFSFNRVADIESELIRVGTAFVRFLCRADGISSIRTVIAIADRMPELGAKFYETGPALGIANLRRYFEDQVAAGVLEPHDCEVAAAQLIDSCTSLTFKPLLFNAAGPPDDARISRVVGMAVRTFLAAHRKKG
jgi:AcrR family transcriptional regulator